MTKSIRPNPTEIKTTEPASKPATPNQQQKPESVEPQEVEGDAVLLHQPPAETGEKVVAGANSAGDEHSAGGGSQRQQTSTPTTEEQRQTPVATNPSRTERSALPTWVGAPFVKHGVILGGAAGDEPVFNPTVITRGEQVWMLYRNGSVFAPNHTGTCISAAVSKEGLRFEPLSEPLLQPVEPIIYVTDPRVVSTDNGYVMTYTGCANGHEEMYLATSEDLIHWQSHGRVFSDEVLNRHFLTARDPQWAKSGAILPQRLDGHYLMFLGKGVVVLAHSVDALHWELDERVVLEPRPGFFDADLVEPGPAPGFDSTGIHLIYNGATRRAYATGEAVFDPSTPSRVLLRPRRPLLVPSEPWELDSFNNTFFTQGMAWVDGRVLLYYGTADGKIAVASAPSAHRSSLVDVRASLVSPVR